MQRRCGCQCYFVRIDMYEIWDGDVFLFNVEDSDEADLYIESGFTVREVDLS